MNGTNGAAVQQWSGTPAGTVPPIGALPYNVGKSTSPSPYVLPPTTNNYGASAEYSSSAERSSAALPVSTQWRAPGPAVYGNGSMAAGSRAVGLNGVGVGPGNAPVGGGAGSYPQEYEHSTRS